MKLDAFADRMDELLETDAYAEVDGSPNGLQVARRAPDVEHVGFAVDAAVATITEATDLGVDLLVTHHGLWWNGTDRLTGRTHDRVTALIDHDVGLYVSHLPLDGHPMHGNAAGVAEAIGIDETAPFGTHGPVTVGRSGPLTDARSFTTLVETIEDRVAGEAGVRTFPFGPDEVAEVAIVTGAGTDFLDEAVASGADVLVTGEGKQRLYHEAREVGMNVILAGHYATETYGVRSLAALAGEWGLETTVVDHPTGL